LPLGGLVNHSVHLCMSGCLTLKLSGLWKTVTGAPGSGLLARSSDSIPLPLEFSGEMGIVSRGTGDWFATEVILNIGIHCSEWEWMGGYVSGLWGQVQEVEGEYLRK
jgi:hypothetical protein